MRMKKFVLGLGKKVRHTLATAETALNTVKNYAETITRLEDIIKDQDSEILELKTRLNGVLELKAKINSLYDTQILDELAKSPAFLKEFKLMIADTLEDSFSDYITQEVFNAINENVNKNSDYVESCIRDVLDKSNVVEKAVGDCYEEAKYGFVEATCNRVMDELDLEEEISNYLETGKADDVIKYCVKDNLSLSVDFDI